MNTQTPAKRTTPNLLDEARFLHDGDLSYGASILARAIGRETAATAPGVPATSNVTMLLRRRAVAREYNDLLNAINPGSKLAARRIVIITDAAALAYGADHA